MNKADLIDLIAEDARITKTAAAAAIDSLTEGITRTLQEGKTVRLVGFGTFAVSEHRARNGRNPQTGAKLTIAARRVPKFTPGKILREALD